VPHVFSDDSVVVGGVVAQKPCRADLFGIWSAFKLIGIIIRNIYNDMDGQGVLFATRRVPAGIR